ncbi:MAG: lytic transglycosylase domain-containing protein [Syntrophorhabdaceae bacterium]|nr:lytic transglycosylase domain-containing protein [Syntrophorhabdaceae bacterium]MDD5243224.1 lytic transglycosylase domain-containing protein [Syntrophorhabdaceae bacterium]
MPFRQKIALLFISTMVILCFASAYSLISSTGTLRKEIFIHQITGYLKTENIKLDKEQLRTISSIVYEESIQHELDYRLILAMMKVESNFRHDAVSSRGARGLLQIKPSLAKHIAHYAGIEWSGNKTLDEPDNNIRIGVYFFAKLVDDFENVNTALHAYNVGPTRAKLNGAGKNKPPKTYRGFPRIVMAEYEKNIAILPDP